ncbi:MAG: anti-sigma factor antagonist [Solirubrobacteraceae bacterium]|jgi:anti-anti-sigma factor|nr:anti-sigma factor antagonist [Solirubrobacteraceae bacterium]
MDLADQLRIDRCDQDGVAVLRLSGELDIATAGRVPEAVAQLQRQDHSQVVIDLRQVSLIDSVGVTALLHVRRRMWRRDAVAAFVCAEEPVGRVLRVMGLYSALSCTDDFDEAVASARQASGGGAGAPPS